MTHHSCWLETSHSIFLQSKGLIRDNIQTRQTVDKKAYGAGGGAKRGLDSSRVRGLAPLREAERPPEPLMMRSAASASSWCSIGSGIALLCLKWSSCIAQPLNISTVRIDFYSVPALTVWMSVKPDWGSVWLDMPPACEMGEANNAWSLWGSAHILHLSDLWDKSILHIRQESHGAVPHTLACALLILVACYWNIGLRAGRWPRLCRRVGRRRQRLLEAVKVLSVQPQVALGSGRRVPVQWLSQAVRWWRIPAHAPCSDSVDMQASSGRHVQEGSPYASVLEYWRHMPRHGPRQMCDPAMGSAGGASCRGWPERSVAVVMAWQDCLDWAQGWIPGRWVLINLCKSDDIFDDILHQHQQQCAQQKQYETIQ